MSLGTAGDLQACVLHPAAGRRALFTRTGVPSMLLWGGVLLMIVRLVRQAARHGAFTPRAAALLRQLGRLVLAGCVVVGALDATGTDLLTGIALPPKPFDGSFIALDALVRGATPHAGSGAGPRRGRAAVVCQRDQDRRGDGRGTAGHRVMAAASRAAADTETGAAAIRIRLDDLLAARGMTLTELSQRVGITVVNLSALKNGRARAIRFSTRAALCAEPGCQPGDLLGYEPGSASG